MSFRKDPHVLSRRAKPKASVTDTLTAIERSKRMSLVRGKDTKPELTVRSLIHRLGFRYRLHGKELPGTPDLMFPSRRKVIFVHGCFWHRHPSRRCRLARLPKSRLEFWVPKLEQNRVRDKKQQAELRRLGWRVLVIWECELQDLKKLKARTIDFLNGEAT
jgi:DNA mismatch endonuclease, patch repair protein